MKIKNILKVILATGCISLMACEEDGPSLLSSGGWTLNFSRQDAWSNNVVIRAQCVSGMSSINISTSADSSHSLTCAYGDSIRISMPSLDLGDNLQAFEINGVPVQDWDGWEYNYPNPGQPPAPFTVDESKDGQLVFIKARALG